MASLTLAIDSSSTVLSVAVVKNADSVFELNSVQFQDHSQLGNARSSAGTMIHCLRAMYESIRKEKGKLHEYSPQEPPRY
jgi:hypothetical protein